MRILFFLFFTALALECFPQSELNGFVSLQGGIYFPSEDSFKEVYPQDVLSLGATGGIGSGWLYGVAKYRRFNAEGTPVLGHVSGDATADWRQSAWLFGLRFTKQEKSRFYFDVLYCTTFVNEKISLNDPSFTLLDRNNSLRGSGFGLGCGFDKRVAGPLCLNIHSELASAKTALKGNSLNLGYFFLGLGLKIDIL